MNTKHVLRSAAFALGVAVALPAMADEADFTRGKVFARATGPNCAAIQVRVDSSPAKDLEGQYVWFQLRAAVTPPSTPIFNKDELLEEYISAVPGTYIEFVATDLSTPCYPHGNLADHGAAVVMQHVD